MVEKTGSQREKLLLAAWPNMTPHHRPDIRAYRASNGKNSVKLHNSYMFPYINLEDLKHGSNVLRFLNSRGRTLPAVFATSDLESIHIGIFNEAIHPVSLGMENFLASQDFGMDSSHDLDESDEDTSSNSDVSKRAYCIDLKSHSLDRYGRLGIYRPSKTRTKRGERPNVGEALLLLRIQQRTLEFLVKLCRSMLHDKKLDEDLMSAPILPEPAALHVGDGEWVLATDLARDAPYVVPGKPDLKRLLSLAHSRLAEWKDYALSMREDPQFFADVVGDWSEHSGE